MPTPEQHALLSASGAIKWLNCTPSARLEAQFPESPSEYAEEGRLAHAIAELKLRKYAVEPMSQRAFNAQLKKLQENPLYQPEMLQHTEAYLDYIKSVVHAFPSQPYIAVEKRLDFSDWVPEGFGTGDCIVIGNQTLHVIDFKYGKGKPVSAEENPQMMLYALGAYAAYSLLYDIRRVVLSIVQPRLADEPSVWETPLDELLAWGEKIKPVARAAYNGEGECTPGDWCDKGFCRARALCRARSEFNLSLEEYRGMMPPLISNEEVGEILQRGRTLAAWLSALEEYALAECLAGNEIPGWKAVEGRSVRQFADVEAAFEILKQAGYDEALLYERRPITLAAAEKLVGKKQFAELLAGQIITPPGKPTLVPVTDKREPITARTTAAEDFKTEIGGNENAE